MKFDKKSVKEVEEIKSRPFDTYHDLNEFKADFGTIYNHPDPRAYFSTLEPFDYRIPQVARPVLRAVFAGLRAVRGQERVHAVDLGCSYGINAALLKRGLSMKDLYAHYCSPELAAADPATAGELDARFYRQFPPSDDLRITGLDAAENAVAYARRTGLVDAGVTADLESAPSASEVSSLVADAGVIISTGCVGYVTRITFDRLLKAAKGGPAPWVASFVLRMFSYDDIAETLAGHGLVTERLEGVLFPQRRFATPEEQAQTLATLHGMGIDTVGLEDRHGFLAEFWLSRPRDEARELPLQDMVTPAVISSDAVPVHTAPA